MVKSTISESRRKVSIATILGLSGLFIQPASARQEGKVNDQNASLEKVNREVDRLLDKRGELSSVDNAIRLDGRSLEIGNGRQSFDIDAEFESISTFYFDVGDPIDIRTKMIDEDNFSINVNGSAYTVLVDAQDKREMELQRRNLMEGMTNERDSRSKKSLRKLEAEL